MMSVRKNLKVGIAGMTETGKYGLKKYEYILSGAATAAVSVAAWGIGVRSILVFAVCWLLIIIAITDIKYMMIPDRWVLLLGAVALILLIPGAIPGAGSEEAGLTEKVIGIFIISAPMAVLNLIAGDCFGGGDIKLTAACGFLLGWKSLIFVMMAAFLAAGIFAAALLIIKRKGRRQFFAFGPFICTGVMTKVLWPGMSLWSFSLL